MKASALTGMILLTALLACLLSGCGDGPEDLSDPAKALIEAPAEEPWVNPVDRWYQEMASAYGNGHTNGFLNDIYGDAWQAELEAYLERVYPDSEYAELYRESIAQAAEARRGLQNEEEAENGWTTGSGGRISMAGSQVYRAAFFNLVEASNNSYPYCFDEEVYTATFLEGLEN